jgi:hypothetical protein
MVEERDRMRWQDIPRLSMTIAEAGYQRYQVRLQALPGGKTLARLTTLSNALRNRAAHGFRKPYVEPDVDELQQCGREIYSTFIPRPIRAQLDDVAAAFRSDHDLAPDQPAPLRLRLELRDPLLHYLPWEFLRDPDGEVGGPQSPLFVSRYTPSTWPSAAPLLSPPLRILVVVASPAIKGGIDLGQEMDALTAEMGEALDAGSVELEVAENPTRDELAGALARGRPHILHYIGHGFISRGTGFLALRQPMGSFSDFLSPAELGSMIAPGQLRLLGLQTPASTTNYQLPAFAGFAAEIAAVKVDAICFSLLWGSPWAFGELYAQLARGIPVGQALQGSWVEGTPTRVSLHQYAPSSEIVAEARRAEVRVAPSEKAIEGYQSTLQRIIEGTTSEQEAGAIREAGDQVLKTLELGKSQPVLTPHDRELLDTLWQDLESATREATGRSLDSYVEVPPSEWEEVRQGSRATSESEAAGLAAERADEIRFVQDGLDQLYQRRQQVDDEPPSWLQREIASYEDHLTGLIQGVRGGESDA